MIMLYVLEGPDLAGKSTLTENLKQRLEADNRTVRIVHTGPPVVDIPGKLFRDYFASITTWDEWMSASFGTNLHDRDVIFDRLHLGELFYGPLLRNKSQITQHQARALDDYLFQIGAVMVHVDAPNHVLRDRYISRGEKLVTMADVTALAHAYREYVSGSHWITWLDAHSKFAGI